MATQKFSNVKVGAPLTAAEWRVVELVPKGRTNDEIAAALNIATETVKEHLARVRYKLGLKNRVQLAVWVLRKGDYSFS